MLHVLAIVAGLVVVAATWSSVFTTLVVPRGQRSRVAFAIQRAVGRPFRAATRLWGRGDYLRTDRWLAVQAPFGLLVTLVGWLGLFYLGFWLLLMGAGVHAGDAAREAGSSLFTLGFAAPAQPQGVVITYLAAATGLIVVALQIGYLPTLYAAYNRRENLVTTLDSRAGSPAWGPEVLARHQLVEILDSMPAFYAQWEMWAADVAESHTNYPALVFFRSPDPMRSWVLGLLAVLDSAALYLALAPDAAPSEARLCLRVGYTSLQAIALGLHIPVDTDPSPEDPIDLTYEDFARGVADLQRTGFPIERSAEEAWPHFHGWRVNYESAAYALAELTDAPGAMWSGRRRGGLPETPPKRPKDRQPRQFGGRLAVKGQRQPTE